MPVSLKCISGSEESQFDIWNRFSIKKKSAESEVLNDFELSKSVTG